HPAGVFVDHLTHRHAQGQFDAAGVVDVAGDGVELRPVTADVARVVGVGGRAHRLEPVDTTVDGVGDAGERLDVVDDGRLAEGALDGREGRLDARPGAFALQALDQPGFLAADVRPGPAVHEHIDVVALPAHDVLAQQTSGVQLVDGLLGGAIGGAVLVA